MSEPTSGPTMVANPYRAAIQRARNTCVPTLQEIDDALDAVHTAMTGGCWVSTVATSFGEALATHRGTLGKVRTNVLADLDAAIASEPEKVESTAWQVRWQRMGPI